MKAYLIVCDERRRVIVPHLRLPLLPLLPHHHHHLLLPRLPPSKSNTMPKFSEGVYFKLYCVAVVGFGVATVVSQKWLDAGVVVGIFAQGLYLLWEGFKWARRLQVAPEVYGASIMVIRIVACLSTTLPLLSDPALDVRAGGDRVQIAQDGGAVGASFLAHRIATCLSITLSWLSPVTDCAFAHCSCRALTGVAGPSAALRASDRDARSE